MIFFFWLILYFNYLVTVLMLPNCTVLQIITHVLLCLKFQTAVSSLHAKCTFYPALHACGHGNSVGCVVYFHEFQYKPLNTRLLPSCVCSSRMSRSFTKLWKSKLRVSFLPLIVSWTHLQLQNILLVWYIFKTSSYNN